MMSNLKRKKESESSDETYEFEPESEEDGHGHIWTNTWVSHLHDCLKQNGKTTPAKDGHKFHPYLRDKGMDVTLEQIRGRLKSNKDYEWYENWLKRSEPGEKKDERESLHLSSPVRHYQFVPLEMRPNYRISVIRNSFHRTERLNHLKSL
jgi:hypothetical protein